MRASKCITPFLAAATLGFAGWADAAGMVDSPHRPPPNGSSRRVTTDHWQVGITAAHARVGPWKVSVQDLARGRGVDGWVDGELVFRNVSHRRLRLISPKSSRFLSRGGAHRLIATVGDCGYSRNRPGGRVHAGVCLADVHQEDVKPGGVLRTRIVLYKNLSGMARPVRGAYAFTQRFQYGSPPRREARATSNRVRLHVRLSHRHG